MKGGSKNSKAKKSKLVVTFDADKRKEYLTGFHKRKQERRRFGHDMEAYKKKKAQIEARKIRKAEQKELLASLPEVADVKPVTTGKDVVNFDDKHTKEKFGNVVTVTTSLGELQSDSEDELDDEENELLLAAMAKKKENKEKQMSLFQRIQQKRKGIALPTKRSKIKAAKQNAKRNGGSKVVHKKGKATSDVDGKPDKRKGFHKTRKGSKFTA